MKLLLDENLPHDLRHLLPGHEVATVGFMGWRGLSNGKLLAQAAKAGFDALITKDAGIQFEQNLHDLPAAVVVLEAPSNAIDDIRPLLPALMRTLDSLKPRTLAHVRA